MDVDAKSAGVWAVLGLALVSAVVVVFVFVEVEVVEEDPSGISKYEVIARGSLPLPLLLLLWPTMIQVLSYRIVSFPVNLNVFINRVRVIYPALDVETK